MKTLFLCYSVGTVEKVREMWRFPIQRNTDSQHVVLAQITLGERLALHRNWLEITKSLETSLWADGISYQGPQKPTWGVMEKTSETWRKQDAPQASTDGYHQPFLRKQPTLVSHACLLPFHLTHVYIVSSSYSRVRLRSFFTDPHSASLRVSGLTLSWHTPVWLTSRHLFWLAGTHAIAVRGYWILNIEYYRWYKYQGQSGFWSSWWAKQGERDQLRNFLVKSILIWVF